MSHDHQYLRQLLGIRHPPQLPVLWLALPWLGGVAWGVRVAWRALSMTAPLTGWSGLDWAFTLAAFWEASALGLLLTWAWLYLAWPEHPRVCCWAAVVGLAAVLVVPPTIAPVLLVAITACGAAAAVEQAVATRRVRSSRAFAAPPV